MQTLITIVGINHGNIIHHHHLSFNHIVKLSESILPLLKSSSHYPGETAIRINSYPAGGVFLTQTLLPSSGSQTSHLWYNSRVMGTISATKSENHSAMSARWLNPPWAYANGSPHILTAIQIATTALVPGLNQATRLRGQNELSGQLNVRLCSTWHKDVQRIGP